MIRQDVFAIHALGGLEAKFRYLRHWGIQTLGNRGTGLKKLSGIVILGYWQRTRR